MRAITKVAIGLALVYIAIFIVTPFAFDNATVESVLKLNAVFLPICIGAFIAFAQIGKD